MEGYTKTSNVEINIIHYEGVDYSGQQNMQLLVEVI